MLIATFSVIFKHSATLKCGGDLVTEKKHYKNKIFKKLNDLLDFCRMDREILSTLARRGQAPVSTDQGLTLSQQSGCLYYLETSSKCAPKSAYSVLEVAALAKFGGHPGQRNHQNQHLPRNMSVSLMNLPNKIMPPPVPPKPMLHNNIPTLGTNGHQQVQPKILNHQPPPPMVPPKPRKAVSTMNLNYEHQKENLVIHRPASRSNLLSGSSPRLNFR